MLGLVSCTSPLDRIRTGKRERATQLGLQANDALSASFDANQSYPKSGLERHNKVSIKHTIAGM